MEAEKEQKSRYSVYVDGFNLYFGLKSHNLRRFYWLDVYALARALVAGRGTLAAVKYFTARISSPEAKRLRQASYLEALASLSGLEMYFGKYLAKPRLCTLCGRRFLCPEEKMTDVNIAVQVLGDAFQDRFDTAILVSGGRGIRSARGRAAGLSSRRNCGYWLGGADKVWWQGARKG